MVCDFRALISPHIQICRSTVGIMSLRFNSDGTFRVLQMADIQDGPDVREDTIRLIEAAIRKAHPDLIVLTGDQIRGYDPAYIDTFLRRRGEQPGTHVRAVTEIEAKIRGIKRHPIAKTLTKSQPSDERWMIDGIGTDSPKLVKSAGRNGSAASWNRGRKPSIASPRRRCSTRHGRKCATHSPRFWGRRWNRISPSQRRTATMISNAASSPTNRTIFTASLPVA